MHTIAARDLVDAATSRFVGATEAERFQTWHSAWLTMDVEQRTTILQCLAGSGGDLPTQGQIAQMLWQVPTGRGVHPDAVLTYPSGDRQRLWAVLEYKRTAALNDALRRSVTLRSDDDDRPVGIDRDFLDRHTFRWRQGPWRVPQLAAYYGARSRLFGEQVNAETRWLLVAPAKWHKGASRLPWTLPPVAHSRLDLPVIDEIPEPWQRRDLERLVEHFESMSGDRKQLDLFASAAAAMHAGPGERRWRARLADPTDHDGAKLSSLAESVAGGHGLWDGCHTAVWRTPRASGGTPNLEVRLLAPDGSRPGGYALFTHGVDGRLVQQDQLTGALHDEADALAAHLRKARQIPWNESCPTDQPGNCGHVDLDGATLERLGKRREKTPRDCAEDDLLDSNVSEAVHHG